MRLFKSLYATRDDQIWKEWVELIKLLIIINFNKYIFLDQKVMGLCGVLEDLVVGVFEVLDKSLS